MAVGITVDVEGGLIIESAFSAYVRALDVAAIITAHASCERDLLIRAAHWHERGDPEPPRRFEMWGLGKLNNHFRSLLPLELFTRLDVLNVRRRTLYHYGHSAGATGVHASSLEYIERQGAESLYAAYKSEHGHLADQKDVLEFATRRMLREQALEAVEAAVQARTWATGS